LRWQASSSGNSRILRLDREHQHVRVRTHNGKLLIDVDAPDAQVHVACPLAMVRDVTYELESNAPGV